MLNVALMVSLEMDDKYLFPFLISTGNKDALTPPVMIEAVPQSGKDNSFNLTVTTLTAEEVFITWLSMHWFNPYLLSR